MPVEIPSLDTIFCAAIEIATPEERAAYLDRACGADAQLQARVQKLVDAHFRAGDFLDRPAEGVSDTIDPPPPNAAPETDFGPYKLLEEIGEGGFGVVFLAEQTEPVRRKVAVKVLKPGMATRQVVARFEAERQALAIMDHANIAKVFDAGATSSGRPYFVMELVKGTPITEFCDTNHLPPRHRLELFATVCQAVQHAHQKGIIHRDLKPSNVLVSRHDTTPVVKVIDFGVAKALGQELTEKTLFTGIAQMIGTPLYMSPEQAGMSDLDIDTRSDIYSLGVLLYELLTGTTPFTKERFKKAGYDEIRRIIYEEEPPKPSTRLADSKETLPSISAQRQTEPARLTKLVRGDLDWITMKCLEKDRNRRYATASGLASDIHRYLTDEPVQACPPSAVYRFGKFARRNRARLTVAGVVLFLLILLGVAGGWIMRDRAARRLGAEAEARAALREAVELQKGEKWPEALSAVRRAESALVGLAADPDLRRQLDDRHTDLEMVRRLENARLAPITWKEGIPGGENGNDWKAETESLAEAFRWYGIALDEGSPEEAAERLRERSIRDQLVAALDEWAYLTRGATGPRPARLVAIARAVDPDPWRNRLRDVEQRNDLKALEELATSAKADELAPASAVLLARVCEGTAVAERMLVVVRQVQQRHPSDFWLNAKLGDALRELQPPRTDEAIRYYTAAVALQPESPGAHKVLGHQLGIKGLWNEAASEFRKVIELRPDYVAVYEALGEALYRAGRLDEANEAYHEAIRRKPDDAQIHSNFGRALKDRGRTDAAIAAYREAIRLKPGDAVAHCNLGLLLHNRERGNDEAIREYREAIRLNPALVEAHYNLGNALKQNGQLDEAIDEYRAAIRLKPVDALAHNNLGTALKEKRWLNAAIDEYCEAIRLKPDFALAHNNLGAALASQGRPDAAIAAYREAIRLQPGNARAHYNLGNALRETGRRDEALAELREAVRLDPDHASSHGSLGHSLLEKRRLDEAIAELREAVRLEPDLTPAHRKLRDALRDKGRAKRTEEASKAALKQLAAEFPKRPEYREALAEIHSYRGLRLKAAGRPKEAEPEYCAAISLLKQLAAEFPNRPEFRRHLAVCHTGLGNVLSDTGRPNEAEEAYAVALTLCKQLAGDFAAEPDSRNALAAALVGQASLRLRFRHFQRAEALLEEARPHHEAALKAGAENPVRRDNYRANLVMLVQVSAGLGDPATAKEIAYKIRDLGWDPPDEAFDAARSLSLCIPIVQRNEKASRDEREKQAAIFGDEAMGMLREAVGSGFNDAARFKQDKDLDPLRGREDFKKLLAELD
jgi:tetratricopeptide (TPR) repeat protein